MMAWVVFVIPIQVGMTSFAEISREPGRLRAIVAHGIRSSLVMGVAAAVGMAIVGGPALHLLGAGYAAAGLTPLWILLIGVVPMTFIQAYFMAVAWLVIQSLTALIAVWGLNALESA